MAGANGLNGANGTNGSNGQKLSASCAFFHLIPLPDQYCAATNQRTVPNMRLRVNGLN